MNFDFLQKHFPDCRIVLRDIDGDTFAEVYTSDEADPVKVFYEGEDHQPYTVCFAFQHIHCDETQAVGYIKEFLSGERASIEFFIEDRPCFGGDIEKSALENFSAETLASLFGSYFTQGKYKFTIKVRSALPHNNFDGHFEKDADGKAVFVKESSDRK